MDLTRPLVIFTAVTGGVVFAFGDESMKQSGAILLMSALFCATVLSIGKN
jgi:hypothetical protein